MVSAKHLRIGNVVHDINGESYTIKAQSFETIHNNTLTVFGVPLTPEILESYGFVKSENQYSSSGYFYTLTIQTLDDINYYDTIVFASEGTWVKIVAIQHIKFQYLHQLQNIYFALCGTELTKNGLLDGK